MRPRLLIPLVCFLVTLGVLGLVNAGGDSSSGGGADAAKPARGPQGTDAQIRSLEAAVRSGDREDPPPYAALGLAHLQKARETAEGEDYERAEAALDRAVARDPRDVEAITGLGLLHLGRHEYPEALASGRRALALAPTRTLAYPVLVDAQVELGRYEQAGRALQRMIDLRPDLAGYSRVSYFRELEGDLDGAVEAMELAISAGAGSPESVATVQALLGDLHMVRDRRPQARRAYEDALRSVPGWTPAEAGLAQLDAADGRLTAAARRLSRVVERVSLPGYAIELGELQLAAGDREAARRTFALIAEQSRELRASEVDIDVELAIYEADHGDPAAAIALARRAWRSAPSVRSADAMGWALTRAGRADDAQPWVRRAVARGWREPSVLFHAGMSARAAGDRRTARRYLRRLERQSPRFSAYRAPQLRRALRELR